MTGVFTGFWLLIEDYKNGDGILASVNKGEHITELITSPTLEERKSIAADTHLHENLKGYMLNKDQRDALRRSMAK